jgi:hypothetical protein
MAVPREMYSPRVGSIRVQEKNGAIAVLRGMYSPRLDLSG